MEKVKIFFTELGKFVLILFGYLYAAIIIPSLFKSGIKSKNFWISNLTAILAELIILLIFFLIFHKRIINDFKDYKKNFKSIMNVSIKNWLLGLVIMIVTNVVISTIIGDMASNEELNRNLLLSTPLYAITAMVLIAPFTEEILFRLAPRKIFKRKIPYLIFCAIIFGGLHLLSSTSLIEILYIIPYGALGFFFAKNFYETNNIFSSISTHMIHNTIAVTLAYITLLG